MVDKSMVIWYIEHYGKVGYYLSIGINSSSATLKTASFKVFFYKNVLFIEIRHFCKKNLSKLIVRVDIGRSTRISDMCLISNSVIIIRQLS